jgi:hypothetical protein
MKLILKYISKTLLSGALIVGAGCSDFLEEENPSALSPDTFFQTPGDAEAAINGIYENLRFHNEGAGIFSANFQMLDGLSGTAETETGQNSDLNNFYSFQYTGFTLHLNNWWTNLYESITNANLAIERIPTIPGITEADATKWLAHAKFLRALNYFWLVQLWGDVPLMTQTVAKWDDPAVNAPRAPKEEVYALIESDLLAAEAAGLPMTSNSGFATGAAVKSLLAKVYLTTAGYPLVKTENYAKAAAKAKEVIDFAKANPRQIRLFKTYDSLHTPLVENTGEHIFMIQYAAGIANAGYQSFFLPNNTDVTASGEVGTTVPTAAFLNSYEPGDLRTAEKGFYFQSYYQNQGVGAPITFGKKYVYKHFDVIANGSPGVPGTGNSGLNYPLIRYAEVLLLYAEAQNEVAGPTQEAYDALASVRARAGLTTLPIGTFGQATFREAVWFERWHELSYENKTFFDMLRLRKVYNPTTNKFVDFVGATLNGSVLQEKHLLLPLPAADFRNNPNLVDNNPGW